MGRRRFASLLILASFAAFAGVLTWLTVDFAGTSQLAISGSLAIAVGAGVAQVWWLIGHRSRQYDQQAPSPDDIADGLARVVRSVVEIEVRLQRLDEAPLSTLWTYEPAGGDATTASAAVGERDTSAPRTGERGIGDFFSHLAVRRLLILGEPGSGKTQLSLYLMLSVLEQRRAGEPVPVPLRAADWDPGNESLDTWMTRHLAETYGQPARTAGRLVAHGLIVPVIDGLDELPADLRTVAVMQLNRGGRALRPMVLTCRTDEYKQADDRGLLRDATTVVLMPLSAEAVARYFEDLSREDSRWRPIAVYLREHPDGHLAKALSTPLMAALMHTVYTASNDPAELLNEEQFPGPAEIESHLLDRSVDAVSAISARATNHPVFGHIQRRWLASLAAVMSADISQGFVWWRLVRITPVAQRITSWIRWLGPATMTATIGLLALDWQVAVAGAVAAAVAGAQIWPGRAKMPRQLARPSWQLAISACLAGAAGFMIGSAAALVPLRHEEILTAWRTSQTSHDIFGLLGAAALVSLSISRPGVAPDSGSYLPGLRADRGIAIVRALAVALFTAVGCAIWLPSRGPVTLSVIAVIAFLTVLLGGSAWGQYTCAHLWLTLTGRFPWRLEVFLNNAERVKILRRAEGVVQFRYPVLRERLAAEAGEDTQDDAASPVLRAQNGIVEEVLALPEAITYIRSGTAHERRDEVQSMARTAITENVTRISAKVSRSKIGLGR